MVKLSIPKPKIPNFRKINLMTIVSLLSYLNVLALIPYLFSKNHAFMRYHAKQGLVLLLIWVIFMFSFYVSVIPWIIALYLAIAILYGLFNVLAGRERPMPWIGNWAEKF